jgi:hypothetical protein
MRKWIGIIGALALVGIVVATLVYFFVINKSHPDYENKKPEYFMTAEALFASFREDAAKASEFYNGKIIQVSGQLSSVEDTDGQTVLVFALDQGMFGDEGIRVSMLEAQSAQAVKLTPGKDITLKGFCTGYNDTDVVLNHGSIVQ